MLLIASRRILVVSPVEHAESAKPIIPKVCIRNAFDYRLGVVFGQLAHEAVQTSFVLHEAREVVSIGLDDRALLRVELVTCVCFV